MSLINTKETQCLLFPHYICQRNLSSVWNRNAVSSTSSSLTNASLRLHQSKRSRMRERHFFTLNSQRAVLARIHSNYDQISILLCSRVERFEGAVRRFEPVSRRSSGAVHVSIPCVDFFSSPAKSFWVAERAGFSDALIETRIWRIE